MNVPEQPSQPAGISSFRDLTAWQDGRDLVAAACAITRLLPKHKKSGLEMQMERAAVSIPANIAEAHARKFTRE
jgi:four helix bundle protein